MWIIGAACLALLWVESGIPHGIKRWLWGREAYRHRVKPLDCEMCMGWWLGLAAGALKLFQEKSPFAIYECIEVAISGAIASVLAVLIHKHINK